MVTDPVRYAWILKRSGEAVLEAVDRAARANPGPVPQKPGDATLKGYRADIIFVMVPARGDVR